MASKFVVLNLTAIWEFAYFQAVTKEKKKRSKGIDKSRIEETENVHKKANNPHSVPAASIAGPCPFIHQPPLVISVLP